MSRTIEKIRDRTPPPIFYIYHLRPGTVYRAKTRVRARDIRYDDEC